MSTPAFCIEVRRYAPDAKCPEEGYGVAFHWYTPCDAGTPFAVTYSSVYTPPEAASWFVPQVEGWARESSDWAGERYSRLPAGWRPHPLSEMDPDFVSYVIRQVAPLEWKSAMAAGDEKVLNRFLIWQPTQEDEEPMSLPVDEDGEIITSAIYDEHFVVCIEWSIAHGLTDDSPIHDEFQAMGEGFAANKMRESLYGPFDTAAEAMAWINAYPDGDLDINDMYVMTMNRVRPKEEM